MFARLVESVSYLKYPRLLFKGDKKMNYIEKAKEIIDKEVMDIVEDVYNRGDKKMIMSRA